MDWSNIIKEVCEYQDFTPYRLAKNTGISQGYMNRLALGNHKEPSINKAMQILKYHPDTWIVGGGGIKRVSGGEK